MAYGSTGERGEMNHVTEINGAIYRVVKKASEIYVKRSTTPPTEAQFSSEAKGKFVEVAPRSWSSSSSKGLHIRRRIYSKALSMTDGRVFAYSKV